LTYEKLYCVGIFKAIISNSNFDTPKTAGNVEYFNCLGSMITNYARCACEIKSRIAMAKIAFNNMTLFTSKLDLKERKKEKVKCYT
jgi:hypothetical protein